MVHIAPVGGLLVRNSDVGGQNLQHAHIWWKRGAGSVWTEQEDSLNARLKAGQVELTKRADWLKENAVDQVDCSFLSMAAERNQYRKYCVFTDSIHFLLHAVSLATMVNHGVK